MTHTKTLVKWRLEALRGSENIKDIDHGYYRRLFEPFLEVTRPSFENRGYEMPDLPAFVAHTQGFEAQAVYDDYYWFPFSDYVEKIVIPHKIAVWKSGMKLMKFLTDREQLAFVERLFVHDASKFGWGEWRAYYDRFLGLLKDKPVSEAFKAALVHHYNANDHHPEHWLLHKDGVAEPLEMPKMAALEMIADWMGASESYGTKMEVWLDQKFAGIPLHPITRSVAKELLTDLGYAF